MLKAVIQYLRVSTRLLVALVLLLLSACSQSDTPSVNKTQTALDVVSAAADNNLQLQLAPESLQALAVSPKPYVIADTFNVGERVYVRSLTVDQKKTVFGSVPVLG
jgi:hypothetical protein